MSLSRRYIVGLWACTVLAWCGRNDAADSSFELRWREPWVQPHNAVAAATLSDEYAWRLFVAINWPADMFARAADSKTSFGADRPTVWESWQNAAEVYLSDGVDPGPWGHRAVAQSIAEERRFQASSLKDLPNVRHIVDGQMVPLDDPISSARRLTEIHMNRDAFEYVRSHKLYNLDGQLRLTQRRAVHFPPTSTEVKAEWRPIRAEEQSHYHCVQVHLADGTIRLYGMTALHLVTKDLPNWFWATFEQVDNPSLPDSDGWQLASSDRFACKDGKPDCNRAPAAIGLEGTVWQYYRLRGTLTRFVDARGQPLRLANSELEAGMQQSASCITCHARASIGMAGHSPVRLPIFDTRSDARTDDGLVRRGFVGLPQAGWFETVSSDGRARRQYQPLDFVWSMSKAQPKKTVP
jgi:hypothetical protein